MKKKFLLIALIGFASVWAFGQESSELDAKFNKWSIEGGIGLTKPWQNFTTGYGSPTPGFLATELGVRYMISEYFGFKVDFGYNKFAEGEEFMDFETNSYRLGLQGVLNVGRMMSFQNWTQTIGLLAHGGIGAGYLDYKRVEMDKDYVGNVLAGLTAQFKLSPRIALNIDGTTVANIRQNEAFDGGKGNKNDLGMVFNGTVGLSIYLGKERSHADWYFRDDEKYKVLDSKIAGLEGRIRKLEDNTAAKSDLERTQGAVDGIAKDVDALKNAKAPDNYDDFVKKLVNDGYINVYFDFNSTKVQGASSNSVSFMKAYLAKNTGATVDVQGYADELGSDDYNQKLSQKRADAVVKLLTEAGIDGSRLNAVGKGKDASVDKSSTQARQLARRVTFMVK